MADYEKYIHRCIELAKNGLGNVAPNPLVGSVIVYKDTIIGEGYHQKYGEAHAEVNAINSVPDKLLLHESTLFVNLEPCSHVGKTPPCTDLIIQHKIPGVIIGMIDPNDKVTGKGIEKLREAGCQVKAGILEEECKELNKRFLTFILKKRPYVILKWAQTIDGFIDVIREGNTPVQPTWITNDTAKILVHKWRNEEQSIMVGRKTVEMDNPALTNRLWGKNSPIRIVIDKGLKLNGSYKIFQNNSQVIVYNKEENTKINHISRTKLDFNTSILPQVLNDLYLRQIQSVIIEGGSQLLHSFIDENLWDEARVFVGNKGFGNGLKAPVLKKSADYFEDINDCKLIIYKND